MNDGSPRRIGSPAHPEDEQRPADKCQVYVGGISRNVTRDDLQELFSPFGPISDILVKGRYAFVNFEKESDANAAIRDTHSVRFNGYEISVELASKCQHLIP